MNFGAIGEAMGMARAISNAGAAITDAENEVLKGNATIVRKNAEIDALQQEIARLKGALNVQVAHTEGLAMQARAVRAELTRVDPKNALLKPTGLRYGAMPQLQCHIIFEQHFDKKAAELNLPAPFNKLRPAATK